jgi:hypothetical protein
MAWGGNIQGQLGDGTEVGPEICFVYFVGSEQRFAYCSVVPVSVNELSGVTAVSAGGEHSLALLSNGTVMAWGRNAEGELGNGTTGGVSNVPVAVKELSGVTAISAGRYYSLALLSNGTVMAWGDNTRGELGNGTTGGVSNVPVAVKNLSSVTSISAGEGPNVLGFVHSLALLSNGTVMAWGDNSAGELGNGTTGGVSNVPVAVKNLSSVTAVSAGSGYSLAALTSGTAMAWGANGRGQLGDGTTTGTNLPGAVSELSGLTGVSAGAEHSLALLSNGTVMAWGNNSEGQLGNGSNGNTSDVPVAVSGLSGVTAIAAGGLPVGLQGEPEVEHSLALLGNGTVMAWGNNSFGQLGIFGRNGETGFAQDVPNKVAGLSNVSGVSAGGFYSLATGPPVPGVYGVSPNQGPVTGGTSVTITGIHFTEGTAVDFGSTSATSFTVNSDSSITAISPAETAGIVDVTVTGPAGTSPAISADRFSYGVPTVTGLKPKSGPVSGGTTVLIKGTNLAGTSAVEFGPTNTSSFTVNTVKGATSITAVSPAETAGVVDVTVTGPGGTSARSTKDRFKFLPTVTGVSPNSGPTAGGTSATVTGTGFVPGTGKTIFRFGTPKATSVSCTSTTTCTVISPAHAAGTVDVKAIVNKMASPKNAPADQFTYN